MMKINKASLYSLVAAINDLMLVRRNGITKLFGARKISLHHQTHCSNPIKTWKYEWIRLLRQIYAQEDEIVQY